MLNSSSFIFGRKATSSSHDVTSRGIENGVHSRALANADEGIDYAPEKESEELQSMRSSVKHWL